MRRRGKMNAPDPSGILLDVRDLSVRFGTLEIVRQATFSVEKGQWLMLAGPNGAGKSTLLSAIAQLLPYEGQMRAGGVLARSLTSAARARFMGLLRQDNTLGYAFTVEEIVRLGAYARQESWLDADIEETPVADALRQVGLYDQRGQSALTLSGGELQRAFIAQLLVQDPPLMLLDEPTSHLDLKFQADTLDLLGTWLKQGDRAIISVMHDLSLAARYGTHALLLNRGETVAVGAVGDVLSDPNLNRVYGMNVREFMTGLFGQWRDDNEQTTH